MKPVACALAVVCVGALLAISQGLPSQRSKLDVQPPVVNVRTQASTEDPIASHQQALSAIQLLIDEAKELQAELTSGDAGIVSVQSIKRAEKIEQMAKKLRGRLKGK